MNPSLNFEVIAAIALVGFGVLFALVAVRRLLQACNGYGSAVNAVLLGCIGVFAVSMGLVIGESMNLSALLMGKAVWFGDVAVQVGAVVAENLLLLQFAGVFLFAAMAFDFAMYRRSALTPFGNWLFRPAALAASAAGKAAGSAVRRMAEAPTSDSKMSRTMRPVEKLVGRAFGFTTKLVA